MEMKDLICEIIEKGFDDEDETCLLNIENNKLFFECGGIMENTKVNTRITYCPFCGKELLS